MMALSQAHTQTSPKNFTLAMVPGDEDMWFAIRGIRTYRSGFTALDLAQAAGVTTGRASTYLNHLVTHGKAQKLGLMQGTQQAIFALAQFSNMPVVLDDRGEISDDYRIRAALWKAIRMLKDFSLKKLSETVAQATDGLVSKRMTEKYVKRLERAGYLIVMEGLDRFGQVEYGLKRHMNTGSLPPRLCEAELVYDPNQQGFYGAGVAHEITLAEVRL